MDVGMYVIALIYFNINEFYKRSDWHNNRCVLRVASAS